jgi:hypothetical protein
MTHNRTREKDFLIICIDHINILALTAHTLRQNLYGMDTRESVTLSGEGAKRAKSASFPIEPGSVPGACRGARRKRKIRWRRLARKMSKKPGGVAELRRGLFAKSDAARRMPAKFAAGGYPDRFRSLKTSDTLAFRVARGLILRRSSGQARTPGREGNSRGRKQRKGHAMTVSKRSEDHEEGVEDGGRESKVGTASATRTL